MSKIIWQSSLTAEMTQHLTQEQIENLVKELDDMCANLCFEYEIK